MQEIKVLLADLGTQCIDFPKGKKRFLGGPDRGGLMIDTKERKTVGFPLEICTFLEIEEGWLEGLGTHNIEFLKENEGFWGQCTISTRRGEPKVDLSIEVKRNSNQRRAICFFLEGGV